ncbi:AAA family ATPase [Nostoc sp. UHCC 0926]|uniref:McrB family protein n=1 Tax=unclassified Nostoc TaxID=2593658 RepID=UPI00235DCD7D|nr:AAA family ATPase [Nostoc sp. UHCC 0926]WDD34235.1 AAA family ATPase [Nostoc sp. UHCC 0926]
MNIGGKTKRIFSEFTFDLIERCYVEYGVFFDDVICESNDYDNFLKYVEEPFTQLCQEISTILPVCLAFKPLNNSSSVKNASMVEKLIIDADHVEDCELCLQADFSEIKLLYIQITQWGIKVGVREEIYQNLLHEVTQKKPKAMMELILYKPSILHPEKYLLIEKSEILYYLGFGPLVYEVAKWFKQYLPLLILASADDPIPVIHQYLSEPKEPDFDSWKDKTGFENTELECWLNTINRKGQAIICGSPGTGKTFLAEKMAEYLIGDYGFSELVQFHPAYSYEDFIQGIRPQSQEGKLTYPLVPGHFLEFCKKAESYQDTCVLIIDEINRANLAQVFGELMYLLEYRNREIPLAGGNRFRIPKNVRIIGTMNTADRSIANIDHALRRRFAFIELRPNYDVLRRYPRKTDFPVEGLINILQQLNQAIADKNYEIGISFFLTDNLREDIEDIWRMEIEPYLEEYFFNQLEKVDKFRWDKIKNKLWI